MQKKTKSVKLPSEILQPKIGPAPRLGPWTLDQRQILINHLEMQVEPQIFCKDKGRGVVPQLAQSAEIVVALLMALEEAEVRLALANRSGGALRPLPDDMQKYFPKPKYVPV